MDEQESKQLKNSIAQYKSAVRWLRDARVYQSAYASDLTFEGKTWKNSEEGELAQDARKAYVEAVSNVLFWRKQVDKYKRLSEEK